MIEKIRAGDIYQLNLTFKARFKLSGSPLTFFLDLRQKQRVAYGGIVDTGEVTVLSASPELFIEQEGRTVFTRPMKGTAPRAGTEEADAEARRHLAEDVKQRAENLMIVDLMRNDVGRIAEIGSVEVTDLFTVETYKTLHQMTSGVRATLKKGVGIGDLMRGIFPPGSVIGAPKIRAQEFIRELETEPRGVYCGAMGYISPEGRSLFNVAIRTAVIFRNADGEMGIGSGVVFDSQGPKEYAECLLKMKFLTDPVKRFDLIETLLSAARRGYPLISPPQTSASAESQTSEDGSATLLGIDESSAEICSAADLAGQVAHQLQSSLAKELSANGLLTDVEFRPNLAKAEKQAFMKSLSALSVPALYGEAFGLYLIEAWAAGVPVVQPRHAAFPELVQASGGGVICEPRDPTALAEAIAGVLKTPAKRKQLSAAALNASRTLFNVRAMAEGILRQLPTKLKPA